MTNLDSVLKSRDITLLTKLHIIKAIVFHKRRLILQLIKINERKEKKRKDSTHGHDQLVNTEIRLIIYFAAKDEEALYSQQNKNRS